ncbi:mannitol 1-phosphate dehydrogenase [Setomelanomma holmii]|uniref:Mannitol 1-phosphate dehydrogenase n=1 Tax=Setomelanomma holmii TaxID=210430 RepID=A0A9P4LEY6_9PLEO|nr:mannitol 1-phosphate dehydrogenase [Setomelanomma holmii]
MATTTSAPTFQNHASLPIAIVGGGLGGLALAIGLVKHGISIHIYESASAFSEIGAGVTFGINATTALHLLHPRLLERYKKHATYNADPARANTFYTMRWGTDERRSGGRKAGDIAWHLDDIWYDKRAQQLGVKTRSCIHRARLLEELIALLPEGVTSFGKSFEGAKELDDGSLELRFADGTTANAAAIIGCDGIKSRVRAHVCAEVQASYAGECAYRAVVPRAEAEATLGADKVLNGYIYCGYGGYIITYPIENGDLINMVAIPHDEGDAKNRITDDWTVPTTATEMLQRFQGWYSPLIDLISRYQLPSKWALFHLQHAKQYYQRRICLMGDSAHATCPHLGAGAGMAMEDAYILSSLIATVSNFADIEKAFHAYNDVRRPRTQERIKRSLQAALACDFLLPDVGDNVAILKERLEESYRWLWHIDLEAQLEAAKDIMDGERSP